jgi:hypothetical protein
LEGRLRTATARGRMSRFPSAGNVLQTRLACAPGFLRKQMRATRAAHKSLRQENRNESKDKTRRRVATGTATRGVQILARLHRRCGLKSAPAAPRVAQRTARRRDGNRPKGARHACGRRRVDARRTVSGGRVARRAAALRANAPPRPRQGHERGVHPHPPACSPQSPRGTSAWREKRTNRKAWRDLRNAAGG